jgi:large repetitive protein
LGDSTQLKGTTTLGNSVTWYNTGTSTTVLGKDSVYVTPPKAQYYYVEVKNKYGCKADEKRDSVFIALLPSPNLPKLIGTASPICEHDSIVLKASILPSTATIYWLSGKSWQDTIAKGTTFTSPNLTTNTTYYIAAAVKGGCKTSVNAFVTIPVTVKPLPHLTISADQTTVYDGQVVKFEANPSTYNTYKWYIDNALAQVTGYQYETSELKNEQVVKVQATLNGCKNWADNTIKIEVKSNSNAFTPNGDGKNDVFLKGVDLTIFNRWGQLLYAGTEGWDGKFNGTIVSPGTYYYIVKLKRAGSVDVEEKSGAVTVVL